jgi:hypothetical protein
VEGVPGRRCLFGAGESYLGSTSIDEKSILEVIVGGGRKTLGANTILDVMRGRWFSI